ncbi:MAG TPA: hypothetical protein DCE23_08965 [Firmicutes bacterium]|nr:hypothetical protein [Bacillota bacterium]
MKGLVLEGGGVKGSYQIGSYYAFLHCHVKLSGFVGTSIGAFNAEMLAEGKYKELLYFWNNVNPGELLEFNKDYIKAVNTDNYNIKALLGLFDTARRIIKNEGIDNTKLLDNIKSLVSYDNLINSNKDFGLVTVKVSRSGFKPYYIYKGDIRSQKELLDYLLASSYLPIFKERRILDNKYYIDGGFFDNSPVQILYDLGYEEVYVVGIKGIGINRSIPKGIKVHSIKPSRDNGRILELNQYVIRDNIKMGYYDTLRYLKNLDGFRYCFKARSLKYYKFITRKIDSKLFKRVMNFFNTDDCKKTVIKALEYVFERDGVDYYKIYNPYKMIKCYRNNNINHFVYKFISKIKFF